jgi:hypothetical protein
MPSRGEGDLAAQMVLDLTRELHRRWERGDFSAVKPPPKGRVSKYCPPELRYDYTGREE